MMADMREVQAKKTVEVRAFFGHGKVFEDYCAATGYRTGEEYVFGRFLHPRGSLLDVGCGTGRTSFLLGPRFSPLVAFDIVEEMIGFAHARAKKEGSSTRFFVGDATALPFKEECFDNVLFAYNGIEAIPTAELRRRALEEVYRALRPGGRFVFTTKSCFNLRYFREFHYKRICSRLGLPLFRDYLGLDRGEVILGDGDQQVHWHTSNPFRVKRMLRKLGFKLLYFNSEVRLKAARYRPTLLANFNRWDHFYAYEK